MEFDVKMEKVRFPDDVVAPWARELFERNDEDLTDDASAVKDVYDYASFVVRDSCPYQRVVEEAQKMGYERIPLCLIALDVLTDPEFIKEDCFLYMELLDDGEEYLNIFYIQNHMLKGFQLARGTLIPGGSIIKCLKKK
jgi:hypothetical protein